jgi:hypothetical protein
MQNLQPLNEITSYISQFQIIDDLKNDHIKAIYLTARRLNRKLQITHSLSINFPRFKIALFHFRARTYYALKIY